MRSQGDPLKLFLIALFGAIGTLARYGLQGIVQIRAAGAFPYGTLAVNLTGCFLLGLIGQLPLNRVVIPCDRSIARSRLSLAVTLRLVGMARFSAVSSLGSHVLDAAVQLLAGGALASVRSAVCLAWSCVNRLSRQSILERVVIQTDLSAGT